MLDPEEKEQLKKRMLTLKIVWGFSMAALALYVVVCHQIALLDESRDMGFDGTTLLIIKSTLAVVAVWSLVVAHFMRKFMLTDWRKGPKSKFIQRMFMPKTQLFTSSSQAAAKYTAATIFPIAFSESVGIFGLVLFFMSGEFITLYIFVIVSAIALYFFRPKFEELEHLAIDLKRHRDSG
jgi:hypothetical protein